MIAVFDVRQVKLKSRWRPGIAGKKLTWLCRIATSHYMPVCNEKIPVSMTVHKPCTRSYFLLAPS